MRIPIVKDAYPYIGFAFILGLFLSWWDGRFISLTIFVVGYLIYFFRDPRREVHDKDSRLIIAPADGRVIRIDEAQKSLSIFMSLIDVHINYAPVFGKVAGLQYSKGTFLRANLPKASERNESNCIEIQTDYGKVWMKQIAGLVARRICCTLQEGDEMRAGEKIGLIKFGSRVDLALPQNAEIWVKEGQHVKGAKTVIGRFV